MQKLEMIKNTRLKNLSPSKKLKLFKIFFIGCFILLTIINFMSLGMTGKYQMQELGSNFMVWKDLQTDASSIIMNQYNQFYTSQQLILAFDVLCLFMNVFLCYSVFKFYTKGNFIILIISIIFWIIRWSASIFFLVSDSDLKSQNQKKYSLIYDQNGNINKFCLVEECTGNLLNYVQCGKLILWKQLQHFQISYIVITILVCVGFFLTAYKTNKLDVKISGNQNQLNQSFQ